MKRILIKLYQLFLVASILFSAHTFSAEPQVLDEVIAIVNNGIITRSQLEERIAELQKSGMAGNVNDSALEQLILETIQLQIGKRANLTINEEDIDAAIKEIATRQNKNTDQLQAELEKQGITFTKFKENVRNDIIINRVQHGSLRDKLDISEQEVDNFLQSAHGKNINLTQYRLLNILLPGEINETNKNFITNLRSSLMKGEVSLKGIIDKQRFDDRPLKINDMGWLSEDAVPANFKDTVQKLGARDISNPIASNNGYNVLLLIDKQGHQAIMVPQYNARHILIKQTNIRDARSAQTLIEQIRERAIKGDDFSSLAKLYSDDESSAALGGELGWATADKYVAAFATALKTLHKGETSPVVKTQFGWHIIQLADTRQHDMSQDVLRSKAHQEIYQKKFDGALKEWLSKIRRDAYIELKK